jgi:phosphate starvation-inducible PhoH-like protein
MSSKNVKGKRATRSVRRNIKRELRKPEVNENHIKELEIELNEARKSMYGHGQNQPLRYKQIPPLEAKTEAQAHLIMATETNDIVFGVGPAGTGKTYVFAALAADALRNNEIDQVIITRPQSACDEEMGFLPGDEEEKFAPWLVPIVEVFKERLGAGAYEYMVKHEKIRTAPFTLMRGRSFKNAYVILDEAQNSTPSQMKMFLTRLGEGSKLMINGDPKQSDLKDGRGVIKVNGLDDALDRLSGVPGIEACFFTRDDIVRHGLIRDILDRYEA